MDKSYRCAPDMYSTKCTPLMIMIINDKPESEIIKHIISNKNEINMQNEKRYTALIILIQNLRMYREIFVIRILKALIDNGADPNIKGHEGWTALMYFCSYTDSYFIDYVLKILLDSKIDVNIQLSDGTTALMIASRMSCLLHSENTVKLLLAANSDVNLVGFEGWTPLMGASARVNNQGTINIIKMLLYYNTDVNIKSTKGETASNIYIRRHNEKLDNNVLMLLGTTKRISFNF